MRVDIPWTKYVFNPENLIAREIFFLAKEEPEAFISQIKTQIARDSIEGVKSHQFFLFALIGSLILAIITAILGWFIVSVFVTLFFVYVVSVFLTTGSFWLFAFKRYRQAKVLIAVAKEHEAYESFCSDHRIRESNYGIFEAMAWLRTAGHDFPM